MVATNARERCPPMWPSDSLGCNAGHVPEDALDLLLRGRQLVADITAHEMPDGRGLGFEQRRLGLDLDGIDHLADFENYVDTGCLRRPHRDVAVYRFFETLSLEGNFVGARVEVRNAIHPLFVGQRVVGKTGSAVLQVHCHSGNNSGRRIGNPPDNGPLSRLGEGVCCNQKQKGHITQHACLPLQKNGIGDFPLRLLYSSRRSISQAQILSVFRLCGESGGQNQDRRREEG